MSAFFSSAPPAYTLLSSEHASVAQGADKEPVELQYPSDELKQDREIVMAAIANDGLCHDMQATEAKMVETQRKSI
jgi:hypothetical protein